MKLKILSFGVLALFGACRCAARAYFVSPSGRDRNPGTLTQPFRTLQRAQQELRHPGGTVYLRGGVYYLPKTLVFTAQDSGTKDRPVVFEAYGNEQPVISGGVRLTGLQWRPFKNGIMQATVPTDLRTEELFVNGQRQILARYPNYDPSAKYFDGFTSAAKIRQRAVRWLNPAGGYLHAMHVSLWGDYTWRITGKDAAGDLMETGGWQNNRGGGPNPGIQFVENIFEELDAPHEWFLNTHTHTLYYYPPADLDLSRAVIEATRLPCLVEFRGDDKHPVRHVTLKGLTFRQASRTMMETREPLLRSDWRIFRGGAVFFNGSEDCSLSNCFLDQLGGNAIFVSDYNRRVTIRACHIDKAGANGVCFVGDPKAVRNPLFNYHQSTPLKDIDRTPGPKTDNYPADCLVDDCLIHETGRVEKQTAGVEIDLARSITVRHCSIYDMPRAGINIGDGCWGGDVIEYCDIFDTVKETGDHGSFNAWGRDRYWLADLDEVNARVKQVPDLPFLDATEPIILRNNRWRCDHGWDIDLDDGSTNYVITNNLCLHGGIKNREGYRRIVENNIIVDSTYYPQVWFASSGDVFEHNIIWRDYDPARMYPPPWGRRMDYNLVQKTGSKPSPATGLRRESGRDEHSLVGDADFVDPATGDYRVRPGSPALALGFVNFPMSEFGVQDPKLKAIARTPRLPRLGRAAPATVVRDASPVVWLGATVRNIRDAGEMSAFGLPGVTGVLVMEVPARSRLAGAGVRANDVILSVNGIPISDTSALLRQTRALSGENGLTLGVSRNQKTLSILIGLH
ncbi:hypothetical protein GALL_290060 [mine drainage metagenome]|uniref:PDZ domain-containing protein n=1 Tax=mine drainage metagenome TaxID=410659 RepID=A0A1J5RLT2_9ZZZZ